MLYYVDMSKDKKEYNGNGSFANVGMAKAFWENKGYHVRRIVPETKFHRCSVCGKIVRGTDDNVCPSCKEV